jgi:hypothetical protein
MISDKTSSYFDSNFSKKIDHKTFRRREQILNVQVVAPSKYTWELTVWRLAKVAIFTTNVDAENQCLINNKCVCGALNRHFCQTPVSGSVL